jgi:hypothetical protein
MYEVRLFNNTAHGYCYSKLNPMIDFNSTEWLAWHDAKMDCLLQRLSCDLPIPQLFDKQLWWRGWNITGLGIILFGVLQALHHPLVSKAQQKPGGFKSWDHTVLGYTSTSFQPGKNCFQICIICLF